MICVANTFELIWLVAHFGVIPADVLAGTPSRGGPWTLL